MDSTAIAGTDKIEISHLAVIDFGFNIVTERKLRLRAVDAPEIDTEKGLKAKEFLEKRGVRTGAKILIKTYKADKYDRCLADVWTEDNTYINQTLVDEDLAVLVKD